MPDPQLEPPRLKHACPGWLFDHFDDIYHYLRISRVVAGDNVTITDAPGAGKVISAEPGGSSLPLVPLIISVNGVLFEFRAAGIVAEDRLGVL